MDVFLYTLTLAWTESQPGLNDTILGLVPCSTLHLSWLPGSTLHLCCLPVSTCSTLHLCCLPSSTLLFLFPRTGVPCPFSMTACSTSFYSPTCVAVLVSELDSFRGHIPYFSPNPSSCDLTRLSQCFRGALKWRVDGASPLCG